MVLALMALALMELASCNTLDWGQPLWAAIYAQPLAVDALSTTIKDRNRSGFRLLREFNADSGCKAGRGPSARSHRQLGDLLTRSQFRVQLEMFRWCDKVVCNSRAAADRLARAGLPTQKLVVIGNGMPPSAFVEASPDPARLPGVLRIGMISPHEPASQESRPFSAGGRPGVRQIFRSGIRIGGGWPSARRTGNGK